MNSLDAFYNDFTWLAGLIFTILTTYVLARMIYLLPYPNARKLLLGWGIFQNLCLLLLISTAEWRIRLIFSFGITFYTLESISCLVDVYRKEAIPSHKMTHLIYYLGFFPRFFAGPLLRYKDFVLELEGPRKKQVLRGLSLMLVAVIFKYLFVDSFSKFTISIFSHSMSLGFFEAWIGTIFNYFELYFYFSAFSLFAIGIGLCFGFNFPENFKSPLLATSITSFWDRWNVTLGDWIKAYCYLPLALKFKHSKALSTFLLFSVMIIISLWYGLNFKFLAMGVWFGIWIIFEQVDRYHEKIPPFFKGIFTFVIVSVGFLFFRVKFLSEAERVFHSLFASFGNSFFITDLFKVHPLEFAFCLIGILFCFLLEQKVRLLLFQKSIRN